MRLYNDVIQETQLVYGHHTEHLKINSQPTIEVVESPLPVLPVHVGHKAAVPSPALLVVCPGPHYLDGGQGAEAAKQFHQTLLRDLERGRNEIMSDCLFRKNPIQ